MYSGSASAYSQARVLIERLSVLSARFVTALSLGCLAACGVASPVLRASRPVPQARPETAISTPRPPPRDVLWLRLDKYARSGIHDAVWRNASNPVKVELLPDGSVRAIEMEAPALLLNRLRDSPNVAEGLGLFVQRSVELRSGAPDGPVVGVASAGTYLPILERGPTVTKVLLPCFDLSTPSPMFVDSGALGIEAGGPSDDDLPAPAEPGDYLNIASQMSATIGGEPFASTICGPLHVVAHDGSNLRVTQSCGGIRVTGWMLRPDDRRGDNSCAPRTIEPEYPNTPAAERRPLPPGYVAMSDDPALRDPLGPFVRRGGSLYWLVPHDDGFKCVGWQVVPVAKSSKSEGGAVLRRVYFEEGHRNVVTFGLGYSPRSAVAPSFVELDGPSWQGDGGEGVGLCDQLYSIVGVDREHVSLIEGEYLGGLVGFHPDDTEDWFFTRAACEARAADLAAKPFASLGSVHHSC